jgi:hypothetical protein
MDIGIIARKFKIGSMRAKYETPHPAPTNISSYNSNG